ncbi:TPA: phage tail fiber protein [Pseudomonas aeruginosa]
MTVSTTDSVIEYEGNGVTTAFPVPFKFPANGDLVVTKVYNDVSSTLVLGTDYSVVGAGASSGGAVITTIAPPLGATINISRDVAPVQETDLRNQGRYFAETHENVFDYLTMLIQQCFSGLSRALKRPLGKDYFYAENRRITNVSDPIEDRDAANKEWTQQYVGSVISSGTGPINLASNVIYLSPTGSPYTVQDMSNTTDLDKGAGLIARASRHLNDLTGLIGLIGRYAGDMVQTAAYWGGWSVYADGPVGGGTYVWDPARPRSEHNAGNVISPTVPWDGLESSFAAYIAKTGETEPSALGCWVLVPEHGREFNVLQWGAKNNATVNGANDAMIQPLLNYVEAAVGGGFGGIVYFPRGNYRFLTYFNVRDRTTLRGEGTSATILQFPASTVGNCITFGPTGPNHPTRPAGEYVFANRLEKLAVSASNVYKGLDRALVYTDGAHEHSGLYEVVLRDFVSYGVHYSSGNGGPASFKLSSVEMYGSDTAPSSGVKRGLVCNAGGAQIVVEHSTITGGDSNPLAQGIAMFKDNLVLSAVHFENCNVGVSLSQIDAAAPKSNTILSITGNSTVTPGHLVDISSTFQGSVSAHGLVNTSLAVTGLGVLINRKTGEAFLDQALGSYTYPQAVSPGSSIAHAKIGVSGGVATVIKQTGRTISVSRTGVGVVRVTVSPAFQDADFTVTANSRPSGGGAMFTEVSPVSASQFDIKTYNQAGTATDPSILWFDVLI